MRIFFAILLLCGAASALDAPNAAAVQKTVNDIVKEHEKGREEQQKGWEDDR